MSALSYPTGDNTAGATGPAGPAGPAGNPYLQATTDSALSDGAVVKRVSGGHVDLATGSVTGSSDGAVGVALAAASGAMATFYPSGTRAPIAGLGVGPVFRDSTGYLTLSPASGLLTIACGYSDNVGVDVNIVPREFPA